MSAIKFRKRITKFKITIALRKKFGSKGFIAVVKVIKIWRSSGESYKLRYVYPIWGTPGDINLISFILLSLFNNTTVMCKTAYTLTLDVRCSIFQLIREVYILYPSLRHIHRCAIYTLCVVTSKRIWHMSDYQDYWWLFEVKRFVLEFIDTRIRILHFSQRMIKPTIKLVKCFSLSVPRRFFCHGLFLL